MKPLYLSAFAGLMAVALPAAAEAAQAFATANVNLRAGPSTQYPPVLVVPAGNSVRIFGCLSSANWCDVGYAGYRGWISGSYLQTQYSNRRVYVDPDYYQPLGIPTVTFQVDNYWDRYYRGRDFYRERDRWRRAPPPPPVWRRDGPPPRFMGGDAPPPPPGGPDMDRRRGPDPRTQDPRMDGDRDRMMRDDRQRPRPDDRRPDDRRQDDRRPDDRRPDDRRPDNRGPDNMRPGDMRPGDQRRDQMQPPQGQRPDRPDRNAPDGNRPPPPPPPAPGQAAPPPPPPPGAACAPNTPNCPPR
ncbi:SH3 domain-containing protein [Agrobacterium vitis]|uniref:SH3 domain-containing protein n=1 Tax=Agrobacterium vitis TaxID=373 RepID=UPI001F2E6183|nr:SH3 domain-containing protein [Agrobacterium vitis]MCF1467891.1 SH3 domain-containing protein [Agrobacterium vitis]